MIDLRFGRYQTALADVARVDCLLVDAPYSARTHTGHDGGTASANRVRGEDAKRMRIDSRQGKRVPCGRVGERRKIPYKAWGPEEVWSFVRSWSPRTDGWFCTITDHVLARVWMGCLDDMGRYVFAPIPIVEPGSGVRIRGDGPSSWAKYLIVARPRTADFSKWGTLPGAYVQPPGGGEDKPVVGGKALWLMRALVRDYSRAGDLVCDPCAGAATTLLAARLEGRRAIGAEPMKDHFNLGLERLAAFRPSTAVQATLFEAL